MSTAETITLSWSPTGDTASLRAGGAGVGGGQAPSSLVIPSRLGSVRLIRELGHGGMGVVWLGHHEFLDRQVAVKFLLTAVTDRDDPRFQVFLDGARAAAQVRHLGLTAVLHADIVEHVPYLVMEYVSGPTLADLVERLGPLRLPAVLAVLERIADALDKLHEAGVVHRDIKPSNILVDVSGQAYLTDFGLACRAENREQTATAGTPAYMAPECFEGEVSARTDIYALAATAYHLLAGRAPYEGSVGELREKHRSGVFPPEPLQAAAVPQPVIELLRRASNADPRFRTKSCHKLLEGFREAAGRTVTSAMGVDQLARLVGNLMSGSAGRDGVSASVSVSAPLAGAAAPAMPGDARTPAGLASGSNRVLEQSVPCVQCGYDLRGLSVSARCPECHRAIEHSLRPERLIYADPGMLGRINAGLWTIAAAEGVLVLGLAGIAVFRVIRFTLPYHFAPLCAGISIVALVVFAIGHRLADTRERAEGIRAPYRPLPWPIGSVGAAAVAALAVMYMYRTWDLGNARSETHLGMLLWAGLALVVGGLAADACLRVNRLLSRGEPGRWRGLDQAAVVLGWTGAVVAIGTTSATLAGMLAGYSYGVRIGAGFATVAAFGAVPVLIATVWIGTRLASHRRRCLTGGPVVVRPAPSGSGKSSTYYQSLTTLADRRKVASIHSERTGSTGVDRALAGVLTVSVPCCGCGGDLAGSHVEHVCADCRTPIRRSLEPCRLIFAPSAKLDRAARGFRRSAVALLVGLLLLAITVPFLFLVGRAAAVLSLVYTPFWFMVAAVALEGLLVGAGKLGLPGVDRANGPWRAVAWSVLILTIVSVVSYGYWQHSSGAVTGEFRDSVLLGLPALVLLVPSLMVPVVLRIVRAAFRYNGAEARELPPVAIVAALPVGLLGVAYILAGALAGVGVGHGVIVFLVTLVATMSAASYGLSVAYRGLAAAAKSAVDYRLVRSAIDSAAS